MSRLQGALTNGRIYLSTSVPGIMLMREDRAFVLDHGIIGDTTDGHPVS